MKSKIKYSKKYENDVLAMPELLPGLRGEASWDVRFEKNIQSNMLNTGLDARMNIEKVEDPAYQRFLIAHEFTHASFSPLSGPKDYTWTPAEVLVPGKCFYITEEFRVNAWIIDNEQRLWLEPDYDKLVNEDNADEFNNHISNLYKHMSKQHSETYLILVSELQRIFQTNPLTKKNSFDIKTFKQEAFDLVCKEFFYSVAYDPFFRQAGLCAFETLKTFIKQQLEREDLKVEEKLKLTILEELWIDAQDKFFGVINKIGHIVITHSMEEKKYTGFVLKTALDAISDVLDGAVDYAFKEDKLNKTIENLDDDIKELVEKLSHPDSKEDFLKSFEESLENKPNTTEREVLGNKVKIGSFEWLPLIWKKVPLKNKLPAKKILTSKKRSTDMGVVPVNIHRSLIDGNVFSKKIREQSGSVLIDDSGSMHFEPHEILEIVEHAPASVIAIYAADRPSYAGHHVPNIKIIAKKGKFADPKNFKIGANNNLVDFPALEWLATQPTPRIWVSDGQAVALNGDWPKASGECAAFAKANKINIVATAKDAAEVFAGRRSILR